MSDGPVVYERLLLRKWRKALGLTPAEVGARLPRPTDGRGVSKIELRDNSMAVDTLLEVVRALGVPGSDDDERLWRFFLGPGRELPKEVVTVTEPPAEWAEFERLPLMGKVGAGPGRAVELRRRKKGDPPLPGPPPLEFAFRRQWIDSTHVPIEDLALVMVSSGHHGESMMPTIRPGAQLCVDTRPVERVQNGGLYVVWIKDEGAVVKEVHQLDDRTLLLWSENPDYRPRARKVEIPEGDVGPIRGRVLWIAHDAFGKHDVQRRRGLPAGIVSAAQLAKK